MAKRSLSEQLDQAVDGDPRRSAGAASAGGAPG